MKRVLLSLTLALPAVAAAQAQPAPGLRFSLSQDLIKRSVQDGKTVESVVQSPRSVLPGDVLREETTVRNVSGKAITPFLVGVPIPKGTTFTGVATATTGRWKLLFSADGGKTYSAAPQRAVTVTENGAPVTRRVPAPLNTYTHVRWAVSGLEPGETLNFSFRVKVN